MNDSKKSVGELKFVIEEDTKTRIMTALEVVCFCSAFDVVFYVLGLGTWDSGSGESSERPFQTDFKDVLVQLRALSKRTLKRLARSAKHNVLHFCQFWNPKLLSHVII